jgi:hypothetical protein
MSEAEDFILEQEKKVPLTGKSHHRPIITIISYLGFAIKV